jgi:hypothetical protein
MQLMGSSGHRVVQVLGDRHHNSVVAIRSDGSREFVTCERILGSCASLLVLEVLITNHELHEEYAAFPSCEVGTGTVHVINELCSGGRAKDGLCACAKRELRPYELTLESDDGERVVYGIAKPYIVKVEML